MSKVPYGQDKYYFDDREVKAVFVKPEFFGFLKRIGFDQEGGRVIWNSHDTKDDDTLLAGFFLLLGTDLMKDQ